MLPATHQIEKVHGIQVHLFAQRDLILEATGVLVGCDFVDNINDDLFYLIFGHALGMRVFGFGCKAQDSNFFTMRAELIPSIPNELLKITFTASTLRGSFTTRLGRAHSGSSSSTLMVG